MCGALNNCYTGRPCACPAALDSAPPSREAYPRGSISHGPAPLRRCLGHEGRVRARVGVCRLPAPAEGLQAPQTVGPRSAATVSKKNR